MEQRHEVKEIMRAIDATGVVVHGVVHGSSDEYEEPQSCNSVGETPSWSWQG